MKALSECSKEELKEAIWHLSENRIPGGGPYVYDVEEVRDRLYIQYGEVLGHHEDEYIYSNRKEECDCSRCEMNPNGCVYGDLVEIKKPCQYANRFQRLPRWDGGLGLCKKL